MDLWRRVRWGNVGRTAGVATVVAIVVAWPRLASDAPRVPGAAAVPIGGEVERPVVKRDRPAKKGRVDRRPARPRRKRKRVERPLQTKVVPPRRAAAPPRAAPGVVAQAPPVTNAPPPVAAQDAPAPPDPDPVASEFGFERSGP